MREGGGNGGGLGGSFKFGETHRADDHREIEDLVGELNRKNKKPETPRVTRVRGGRGGLSE